MSSPLAKPPDPSSSSDEEQVVGEVRRLSSSSAQQQSYGSIGQGVDIPPDPQGVNGASTPQPPPLPRQVDDAGSQKKRFSLAGPAAVKKFVKQLTYRSIYNPAMPSSPLMKRQSVFNRYSAKMEAAKARTQQVYSASDRFLRRYVPLYGTVQGYTRQMLLCDTLAGITVGAFMIPQGMAYASLAKLPPVYGLYTGWIPLMIYAIFGSSRQLSVGPVALICLLIGTGVTSIVPSTDPKYFALCNLLAFMVGTIQLTLGLFRLGFLANFLSPPVLHGVISAAAIVIIVSQLKVMLGVEIPKSEAVYDMIYNTAKEVPNTHGLTLAMSIVGILLLVMAGKLGKKVKWTMKIPWALVLVVLSILVTFIGKLDSSGVKVVGSVPAGLPEPSLPSGELLPVALSISVVAYVESISVAKTFALKKKYDIDPNQELLALGLSNLLSLPFQVFPSTGALSRSAVNFEAGAESGIASMISSLVVTLTLLFLTPLFYYLPKCMLAAIIVVSTFGFIDVKEVMFLWKVKKRDFLEFCLSFAITFALGIEEGVAASVIISMILVVYSNASPHAGRLGKLPNTHVYREIKRFPEAETVPGVVIFKMDSPLYFVNLAFFKEKMKEAEDEAAVEHPVKAIVVDASSMPSVDTSSCPALMDMFDDYAKRDIRLVIADIGSADVRDVFELSGLTAHFGQKNFFFRVHDAVLALQREQDDLSSIDSLSNSS